MRSRFSTALIPIVVLGLLAGQAWAFSPARTVPDAWERIGIWVDQLGSLTSAQMQFAASHYAGTQKQTASLIDSLRIYNPNFLMIQYRLGMRDSGDQVQFIHDNTWSSDWADLDPHEDFFAHVTGYSDKAHRIYMSYGSIKEWVMDAGGLINGNTSNGFKEWWNTQVLSDIADSHADGVFADSSHLPYGSLYYGSGTATTSTHLGTAPYTSYMDDVTAWYQYTYNRFDAANMYFVPNIGGLCTTADTNTSYFNYVHGAMVEGYATKTSDWSMQANRELNLLRNGKIWIAQSDPASMTNINDRLWYVTNFLLLKQHKSFLNLNGVTGSQCAWLPEYDVPLGSPAAEGVPSGVSSLLSGSVYKRLFDRGMVLVNPSASPVTYTFTGTDPRYQVTPSGGGVVAADGSTTGTLSYARVSTTTISVPAWSGVILTINPGDTNIDGLVDGRDYTIIADHYNQSVTPAANGDITGDGKVSIADYNLWRSYYGLAGGDVSAFQEPVPEPATLLVLALGGLAVAVRKRR